MYWKLVEKFFIFGVGLEWGKAASSKFTQQLAGDIFL
jgi:hypothetical protein